jgi:hypothetical protein
VDLNAQSLANMAYMRARQLIGLNRETLEDLVASALERETLTREDLDKIFAAHHLERRLVPEPDSQPPAGRADRRGSASEHPLGEPTVMPQIDPAIEPGGE